MKNVNDIVLPTNLNQYQQRVESDSDGQECGWGRTGGDEALSFEDALELTATKINPDRYDTRRPDYIGHTGYIRRSE